MKSIPVIKKVEKSLPSLQAIEEEFPGWQYFLSVPEAPKPASKRSPEDHNTGAETETMIKGLCQGWKPITHELLLFTVSFFLLPIFIVPTKHNSLLTDWFYFPLWSG